MLKRFNQWWKRQYIADQAAVLTLSFYAVIMIIIGIFVLIGKL